MNFKTKAMNINRNNYEHFFLLYTDNELSAADRQAVELFIKENADLQPELDMLQQTIVQPEQINFAAKNSLLRATKFTESEEEMLLLYIDNELSLQQVKELNEMVISNGELVNELNILQQTRLQPDTSVVFPDKSLLYKKEEGRVIPFGWWKLAAAAVFIGFGIWGMKLYVDKTNNVINQSTVKTTSPQRAVSVPASNNSQQPVNVEKTDQQNTVIDKGVQDEKQFKSDKKIIQPRQIKEQRNIAPEVNTLAEKQVDIKRDNNLPKPYFENINKPERNENTATNVTPQTQKIKLPAGVSDGITKNINQPANNNNVYTAVFSETDTDNKQDQFAFSDDEPHRSKMGGFLRKAKRLLERNTKMKPGDNNVKVANLEFAIQ